MSARLLRAFAAVLAVAVLAGVAALSVLTGPPSPNPVAGPAPDVPRPAPVPAGSAVPDRQEAPGGAGSPGGLAGMPAEPPAGSGPATVACWTLIHNDFSGFMDCVDGELVVIVERDGVAAGIEAVRAFRDADVEFGSRCHDRMHTVGRLAGRMYPDPSEALSVDPYTDCQAGYMHGVLEGFAQQATLADVRSALPHLCAMFAGDVSIQGECNHALGHAAAIAVHDSLTDSIHVCDVVPDPEARASCAGGVLMEYGNSYRIAHTEQATTGTGAGSAGKVTPGEATVTDAEAAYPCVDLSDAMYLNECLRRLGPFWGPQVNGDADAFFARCVEHAPPGLLGQCGYSAGEWAGIRDGFARKEDAMRTCRSGPTRELREGCVHGMLENLVAVEVAMGLEPTPVCHLAPDESQQRCEEITERIVAKGDRLSS